MFATGVAMGLAEWIIDDTCLVLTEVGHCQLSFLKAYLGLLNIFRLSVMQ